MNDNNKEMLFEEYMNVLKRTGLWGRPLQKEIIRIFLDNNSALNIAEICKQVRINYPYSHRTAICSTLTQLTRFGFLKNHKDEKKKNIYQLCSLNSLTNQDQCISKLADLGRCF